MKKRRIAIVVMMLFMLGAFTSCALADSEKAKVNANSFGKVKIINQTEKTNCVEDCDKANEKNSKCNLNCKNKQVKAAKVNKINREFKDMVNDWSREEVMEATAKGFISGYEDFTFRPNQPVTCLETITLLIRAEGLDKDIEDYELSEEQQQLLKKIPDWGKPYVAIALDQGLLFEDELKTFNPRQGAKRYEVCMYMARLVEDDASEDDEENSFIDEKDIPAQVREAIRLMQANAIINGYPDKSFKPMRVVKRSEIAKMLNKLDDNCLYRFKGDTIKGELNAITEFEITLTDKTGKVITVPTGEGTKIFYAGKLVDSTLEIKEGCRVKIIVDDNGEAVLVRITPNEDIDEDKTIDEDEEDNIDEGTDGSNIVE